MRRQPVVRGRRRVRPVTLNAARKLIPQRLMKIDPLMVIPLVVRPQDAARSQLAGLMRELGIEGVSRFGCVLESRYTSCWSLGR
jgi:CBS domain-containing protein